MKTKNFNCRNLRWNEIEKTDDKNGYLIKRPISYSVLARGIPFVIGITVGKNELPKHILKLVEVSYA